MRVRALRGVARSRARAQKVVKGSKKGSSKKRALPGSLRLFWEEIELRRRDITIKKGV